MLALGVSGSSRTAGNTDVLVQEVLSHLAGETRFIGLAGLDIHPCVNCGGCWEGDQGCVVADDLRPILEQMKSCDVLVLGSPCYFSNVSSQLKMLIDRAVSLWGTEALRNRIGAAVVTQDSREGRGGEHALAGIQRFFLANRMLYAGGTIGAGGAEKAHVRSDRRAMTEAKRLAERIEELYTGREFVARVVRP
jgi:multimeric flavodoxin WrbA